MEAPSAASVVANGVSGKAGGSYPKVEPKNVPEEADGGKQEVDAGGNTAADEEAGDKVEKSDGGAEANEGGGKVMNPLTSVYRTLSVLIYHTGRLRLGH